MSKKLPPIHPGEILREEFMKPRGLSSNALARALDVTSARINEIVREQHGDLVGVNLIVLGLAAVDGFHIEGMAQHEGNPFLRTEVCQPLPGEDALHGDHKIVAVRRTDAQKRFWGGRQILVH